MEDQTCRLPPSDAQPPNLPPVIAYGPPAPWWRRRLWFKMAVATLLLIAGIIGNRYGMQIATRVARNRAIARAQNDMLTFGQPSSQVVYEEDPARCRVLLASGKGYEVDEYLSASEVAAWGSPVEFHRPTGFPNDAPIDFLGRAGLFLHRRVSPAGNERIVSLGQPSIFDFCRHYRQLHFVFCVGKPAVGPGTLPLFDSFLPHVLPLSGDERLRMFAGQPDPANLSHWTIRYELNGQPGMIDGYLKDNDRIWIQARDGPLMNRILKPSRSNPQPTCPLNHN